MIEAVATSILASTNNKQKLGVKAYQQKISLTTYYLSIKHTNEDKDKKRNKNSTHCAYVILDVTCNPFT